MSERINKIKETYSEQFQKKLEKENVEISLNSAWDILVSSDMVNNKKNVRWLVETYINDGFLWEDISAGPASKVCETLTEFNRHKRNLEPSERSLMKYQTLGDLWSAIKQYVGQLTPGEEKREERERAYKEAEVIVDREDGLKIVAPMTEYAAKWFGRGTRWCTSADRNNMFSRYNVKAPLFIILMPNGDKLQLWKYNHKVQFMDENDKAVTKNYIEKNWGTLKDFVLCNQLYRFMSPWVIDDDIIEHMLNEDVSNFYYVPSIRHTPEMLNRVIGENGDLLEHVMVKDKTYDLCELAVKQNGNALQWTFNANLTMAQMNTLYKLAVETTPKAISHVPEYYRTQEICDIVVKKDPDTFFHVPQKFKTKELCEIAVQANGHFYRFVHKEMRTPELFLLSIQRTSMPVREFPKEFLNEDFCKSVLSIDGAFISYFQQYADMGVIKLSQDMYNMAVRQKGKAIKSIPEEFITKEMCDIVFSRTTNVSLKNIPEKYRTKELQKQAIKANIMNIRHVDRDLIDKEMALNVVRRHGRLLSEIPEHLIDYEMCKLAVETEIHVMSDEKCHDLLLKLLSKDDLLKLKQYAASIRKEVSDKNDREYKEKFQSAIQNMRTSLNNSNSQSPVICKR